MDDFRKLVKEIMGKIRDIKFDRTTDHRWCKDCEYQSYCWPDGLS